MLSTNSMLSQIEKYICLIPLQTFYVYKYTAYTIKEKQNGIPLQGCSQQCCRHRGVTKHSELDLLRNEEEDFDNCDAEAEEEEEENDADDGDGDDHM